MLYDNFELYFPFLAADTITYKEISDFDLVATLRDGRQVLYNDTNHTFRNLPRDSEDMTEEECRYEFGLRLRHIMFRKGVTQEELAERLKVQQPRISKYLNGRATPSFYMVDRIAKALGCSTDEFRYI